jgi:hypothetical protein
MKINRYKHCDVIKTWKHPIGGATEAMRLKIAQVREQKYLKQYPR